MSSRRDSKAPPPAGHGSGRSMRTGLGVAGTALAVAALAGAPGPALGGSDIYYNFHNGTDTGLSPQALTFKDTDSHCMYEDDLDSGNGGVTITPGASTTAHQEAKAAFFSSCATENSWAVASPFLSTGAQVPGTSFYFEENGGYGTQNTRINGTAWSPLPVALGGGLVCLGQNGNDWNWTAKPGMDVWAQGKQRCDATWGAGATPSLRRRGPARPVAPRARATDQTPEILDLMVVLDQACQLIGVAQSDCTNAGAQAGNDFSQLPASITNYKVDADPGAGVVNNAVFNKVFANNTSVQDSDTYNYSTTTTNQTTTSTTRGFQVGGSLTLGLKWTAPVSQITVSGGITFNGSYNYSSNTTQTSGTSTTQGESNTVNVPANTTVQVVVLDSTQSVAPTYEADLAFGTDGTSKDNQVQSAFFTTLGLSNAPAQPCVGYLAGDVNVEQSIMNIAEQVQQAGKAPVPGLTTEFLDAASGFSPSATACKGFSADFPSAMAYHATGSATGAQSLTSVTCVYTLSGASATLSQQKSVPVGPNPTTSTDCPATPPTPTAPSSSKSSNEQQAAANAAPGGATGQAYAVSADPSLRAHVGTRGGDAITGADGVPARLEGRGGDDVLFGRAAGETLDGGAGDDLIEGGAGGDRVIGGPGNDSIHAGTGADVITDGAGRNMIDAGPGGDRITAGRAGRVDAGPGDDRITGSGSVLMRGGPGDDVYTVAAGSATPREEPGQGVDTVRSSRPIALPPDIERLELKGTRGIGATAGRGAQVLVGNAGDNYLSGGPGDDRVVGGPGDDTITLDRFGYDTATGGPGADRFIPQGVVLNHPRVAALATPGARTGHRITDFSLGQGDRLVLSQAMFGSAVARARVERGRRASTTSPTILVAPDGLITYDRDGRGPRDDRVVARVQDPAQVTPAAIRVRP